MNRPPPTVVENQETKKLKKKRMSRKRFDGQLPGLLVFFFSRSLARSIVRKTCLDACTPTMLGVLFWPVQADAHSMQRKRNIWPGLSFSSNPGANTALCACPQIHPTCSPPHTNTHKCRLFSCMWMMSAKQSASTHPLCDNCQNSDPVGVLPNVTELTAAKKGGEGPGAELCSWIFQSPWSSHTASPDKQSISLPFAIPTSFFPNSMQMDLLQFETCIHVCSYKMVNFCM